VGIRFVDTLSRAAEREEAHTFPGHILRGHVVELSPASGAQFALLPPDNASGNFTKMISADALVASSDADLVEEQINPFKALGGGWAATNP
jgi:hypothetical protein